MSMNVNEPRRDDQAGDVDRLPPLSCIRSNFCDQSIPDTKICAVGLFPTAIHDPSVFNT